MKWLKKAIGLACVIAVLATVGTYLSFSLVNVRANTNVYKAQISQSAQRPSDPDDSNDTIYIYGDADDYFDGKSYDYYLHVYSPNQGDWIDDIRIVNISDPENTTEPSSGFASFTYSGSNNKFTIRLSGYSPGGMANVVYDEYDGNGDFVGEYNLIIKIHPWKVIKKINLYNWLVPEGKTYGSYNLQSEKKFERLERTPQTEPYFTGIWWKDTSPAIASINCTDEAFQFTSNALGSTTVTANPKFGLNGTIAETNLLTAAAGSCEIIVAEITPTKAGLINTTKNLQTIDHEGGNIGSPAVIKPNDSRLTYKWGLYDDSLTGDARYTTSQSNEYIALKSDFTIDGLKATPENQPVKVWAEIIPPQDGSYWNYPDKIRTVWNVEVLPVPPASIKTPPRVVNKDCDATHALGEVDYRSATEGVPVSEQCKGVTYTIPNNAVAEPVVESGKTTKIKGKSVGLTDISAKSTYVETVTDNTKGMVVRDLTGDLKLHIGEENWLCTENFAAPYGHTVTFSDPNNNNYNNKITVDAATGKVTAMAPCTELPVKVRITRDLTGAYDETTCHVTVEKIPVDVNLQTVRFTGRKIHNSLPVDFSSVTYKDNKGNTVNGIDVSSQLTSAAWTPSKSLAAIADGKLTPNKPGSETFTASLSPIESDTYTINGSKATLNTDIYGFRFKDKKDFTWVKGTQKDLDYFIELADLNPRIVPVGSGFHEEADIIEDFVRIEIKDEKEQTLLATLTQGGEKEGTDYTIKSGSVNLTLKPAYLNTLKEGKYTVIGYFDPDAENLSGGTDRNEVDTLNIGTFVIEKATNPDPPPTGEDNQSPWALGVCLISFLYIALYPLFGFRKQPEAFEVLAAEFPREPHTRFTKH